MAQVLPPPPARSLAFVIPAYNERERIGATLDAIHRAVGAAYPCEIVVVDNGSTDATAAEAAARGARVLARPHGTIGALRNAGARATRGRFLVFLDADVVPTEGWARHLPASLAALEREPRTLTGGMCVVPADAAWIERTWFAPRSREAFSHIGSGHLLTTRAFFEEIGGFDETLATGEDYDLSARATRSGGVLAPDSALVAEHRGFPRTLGAFVRREAWHGRSDFAGPRTVLRSRVALATVLFAALHLVVLACAVTGRAAGALMAAAAIVALCSASAAVKYRGQPWRIVGADAVLYYFYFLGRTLSLLRLGPGASSRGSRA